MILILIGGLLAIGTFSAGSENLHSIELKLPADSMAIRKKCTEAFQQALQDKEDYESRSEVGLKCAFSLKGDALAEIQDAFMIHCERTASVRMNHPSDKGKLIVDTVALTNSFNEAYGMIFRRDCLDAAVTDFHSNQARSQAPTAGASGLREGCYAFTSGCQ